jgi:predicted transglutaminase-like cysteine proteinase
VPALFGTVSIRASEAVRLPRWEEVRRRIAEDVAAVEACRNTPARCPGAAVRKWAALIRQASRLGRRDQLRAVNLYANRQGYVLDGLNWGVRDYWASPIQFLERSGDCEDYAIFKYASLRLLGFTADDLRLVVLRDVNRAVDHAVLAVHLDGEILVLDNLDNAIRTESEVPHYRPYYSVNEQARWMQLPLLDLAPGEGNGRGLRLPARDRP